MARCLSLRCDFAVPMRWMAAFNLYNAYYFSIFYLFEERDSGEYEMNVE